MRAAFLCYLPQAWTADWYRQAQRDTPARPRAGPSLPRPPRAYRARGLPAVVARRLRTVLGGGSP